LVFPSLLFLVLGESPFSFSLFPAINGERFSEEAFGRLSNQQTNVILDVLHPGPPAA